MNFSPDSPLPIAVIGAGPVGLAAAAHLVQRGLRPVVFERGESVGASLLEWSHVRVFSPWRFNIDSAARTLLENIGWRAPNPEGLPNGGELVEHYLRPLAAVPEIAGNLKLGATVTGITREALDKVQSQGRAGAPFVVRYVDRKGEEHRIKARSVIDASGTWTQANPMGVDGLCAPGEQRCADRIAYGIPDVVRKERERYAGKRTLVIGGGHSSINVALALMELQQDDPNTEILWALRHKSIDKLLGGGLNDQLPERGALGLAAKQAMQEGRLRMLTSFAVECVVPKPDGVLVKAMADGRPVSIEVDRIVVTTGFRPDLSFLRELRIELDPAVEAPPRLAPLIDPNFHSCGTVPPHGIEELRHPEQDFVIAGSKSYGRAPTFLMATGYEQVRSVVAELAGDHAGARNVQLVLPETGVCSAVANLSEPAIGCCGGPAPAEVDACCLADARAKDDGKAGCGCGQAAKAQEDLEPAE